MNSLRAAFIYLGFRLSKLLFMQWKTTKINLSWQCGPILPKMGCVGFTPLAMISFILFIVLLTSIFLLILTGLVE